MGAVLVATQVGLSLVLLIAAASFLRTVWNLRSLTLGFTPEHLLVFSAEPAQAGYRGQQVFDYFERSLERLRAAPGVQSAAFSRYGFLQGGAQSSGFSFRDPSSGQMKSLGEVRIHSIPPGYFDTVGVHRWVAGSRVKLAGIHLPDVSEECRGADPVPADQLRQVPKKGIVRHMVQRVALHGITCERGC
jgi:hypothetical protein